MEFHLIYAGTLIKSAGNTKRRTWEKHALRRHFSDQLKRLWETHPALKEYAVKTVARDEMGNEIRPEMPFLQYIARGHSRSGIGMIPIVTAANGLVCSLDILLLRGDRQGTVIQSGGDIDNRVKLIIDALRIPSDAGEMPLHPGEDATPDPLYCLMQDDNLITSLRVKSDRLLFRMEDDAQNEACAVIRVETANIDPFGSPWELHL